MFSCLQPVTECTELAGDIVAVNTLSFYGSVSHILLKRHGKSKAAQKIGDPSPDGLFRLAVLQARNESAATAIAHKVRALKQ